MSQKIRLGVVCHDVQRDEAPRVLATPVRHAPSGPSENQQLVTRSQTVPCLTDVLVRSLQWSRHGLAPASRPALGFRCSPCVGAAALRRCSAGEEQAEQRMLPVLMFASPSSASASAWCQCEAVMGFPAVENDACFKDFVCLECSRPEDRLTKRATTQDTASMAACCRQRRRPSQVSALTLHCPAQNCE